METYDIRQIMIGGRRGSIIGLDKELKEVAEASAGRTGAKIETKLLHRLS